MITSDVNQVLMFSDRPQSIVRYITDTELQKLWVTGTNHFKIDPPNAILSSISIAPTIIVLHKLQVQGNHISYQFTTNKTLTPMQLSHISLTIDSTSSSCSELAPGQTIHNILNCLPNI